jgi:hypothetical protein
MYSIGAAEIVNMVYYGHMSARGDKSEAANQDLDCIVREATWDDFEAICQVKRRNGLEPGDYSSWARLWNENPFRFELEVPLGWVLESKSQGIVGTFTNVPRIYIYNNEPVRTAVARALAIDPQFRFLAVSLTDKFFSQKNIDLFLNTSASPQVSTLFKFFDCREIPGPSCAQMLFWITNYASFAGAFLRMKRLPPIAGIMHSAGLALYFRDLSRRPKVQYQQKEICHLTSFDERFDAFWKLLRRRANKLMAVRSSEALTWQFRTDIDTGNLVILGVMEGAGLTGYLIMRRYDHAQYKMRRYRVVDIQVIGDEPSIVLSLMSAALTHAAHCGVDVVEAMGFNKSKHDLLERLNPHHRNLSTSPYLYKVNADSSSLQQALQDADAWDPTPFDGDAAL